LETPVARLRRDPVEGWLLTVGDGSTRGSWGPVARAVVDDALVLFESVHEAGAATPAEWGRRLRRGTRHGHAGVLAVASGAFELACWDLLGTIHELPVWRLVASEPAVEAVPAYATCFGVEPGEPEARAVATEVRSRWPAQKWRPPRGADAARAISTIAAAAGADGALALDFEGSWTEPDVLELCSAAEAELAWLEEPYPPDELHLARPGGLPFPHATGEHCYGPHETAALLAAGVEIWQPDAVFCGGFANLCAIAEQAAAAGARCVPHGGGLLPSLHAAAAGAPVEMVELHVLLEPRRQAHLASSLLPGADGDLPIPELPGWGGPVL
jgi:L-alanine-DL-glutamate epimerase-like enolase superfamily enzyme